MGRGRPPQQIDEIRVRRNETFMPRRASSSSRTVQIMELFNGPLETVSWSGMLVIFGSGGGLVMQQLVGGPWLERGILGGLAAGCALGAVTAIGWLVGGLHINLNFNITYDVTPEASAKRISEILTGGQQPEPTERDWCDVEFVERTPTTYRAKREQYPVKRQTLRSIAEAIDSGRAFSRAPLTEVNACSQPEFNKLAGWMGENGLAAKSGNNWELTEAGRMWLANRLR